MNDRLLIAWIAVSLTAVGICALRFFAVLDLMTTLFSANLVIGVAAGLFWGTWASGGRRFQRIPHGASDARQ